MVVNWPLVTRIYYHFMNDVHMPNSVLLHLCQFTCTVIAFLFYKYVRQVPHSPHAPHYLQ